MGAINQHSYPVFLTATASRSWLKSLWGVHVLIDILPLVSHELVPGHAVHSGFIQQHIEGVAAVMGRTLCLVPAYAGAVFVLDGLPYLVYNMLNRTAGR